MAKAIVRSNSCPKYQNEPDLFLSYGGNPEGHKEHLSAYSIQRKGTGKRSPSTSRILPGPAGTAAGFYRLCEVRTKQQRVCLHSRLEISKATAEEFSSNLYKFLDLEELCLCQETHGNWSLSAENDLNLVKNNTANAGRQNVLRAVYLLVVSKCSLGLSPDCMKERGVKNEKTSVLKQFSLTSFLKLLISLLLQSSALFSSFLRDQKNK